MTNEQLDLKLEEHVNDVLSKRKNTLEETKQMAFDIWKKVMKKYKDFSPSKIIVYHHENNEVTVLSCDHINIDESFLAYCEDHELLTLLSIIAENSNIKGKAHLHSSNGFIAILDLSFIY